MKKIDDERNKTVFHNTTPDLQDQDQDRYFWSETGLVLRPTISDHITGFKLSQTMAHPEIMNNRSWEVACRESVNAEKLRKLQLLDSKQNL